MRLLRSDLMSRAFVGVLAFIMVFTLSKEGMAINDIRDSHSPLGVMSFLHWNHDWNSRHYQGDDVLRAIGLMKEAGVGMVRIDFLWDDIEMAPGQFNFAKYDSIVDLLRENNIQVLGILNYNAVWASEYWNSAPNPELFSHYAVQVVRHFKNRVRYWEIWNEPDDPIYWRDQDGMKSYTALLKKTYPLMKEEDPTSRILIGGLSRMPMFSLRQLYREGAKPYFDIVNFHPFVHPGQKDALMRLRGAYNDIRRVMHSFDDGDKDIWITEIGCPGMSKPIEGYNWWMGKSPTEDEQARWVRNVYEEVLQWRGVKKVFWAFFRDTPNYFKNGVDFFGLVRNDFSKKPAFDAYKKFKS